jgi:opacity protein-like surface antigen
MRKLGCAALFAACLAAAPAASAGDFFINGQLGRIDLDSSDFDDDKSNLLQAGAGYRWGIGMAQVGLETGLGKLDDQDGTRADTNGFADHVYTLSSRYAFIGANARVKPPLLPVYVIGRAGYLGLEQKLDDTSIDRYLAAPTGHRAFKETDGGTYVGVGVGTTILPLLDVGLMYNQFRYSQVQYDPISDEYELSDDKRDARSVSLTVEYRF